MTWKKIGENHWQQQNGNDLYGIYEATPNGWCWYHCQPRTKKRGSMSVQVMCVVREGGAWPCREQVVAEMAGRSVAKVERRIA